MLLKLNLGCGPHAMPGWINVDAENHPGITNHDLRYPLPFEDGSAEVIYSEHFIEHLTREEGSFFLMECFRVLRPGGWLRISTPDLKVLAEDYLGSRVNRWSDCGWRPLTPARLINEGMRMWGHSYLYDFAELYLVLTAIYFVDIARCGWHESTHPYLRGLEVRPSLGDLIIEARKPDPRDAELPPDLGVGPVS